MPDLGMGLLGCYRCGYVWRLRRSPVALCPRCKSRLWNDPPLPRPPGPRRHRGLGVEEIIGPHRRELVRIAKRSHAKDLRVFGSVARGEAGKSSDVDLLVKYDRPVGLLARMELKERLQALLGRRVDLATEESLHWFVRPRVLAEAVPL